MIYVLTSIYLFGYNFKYKNIYDETMIDNRVGCDRQDCIQLPDVSTAPRRLFVLSNY